ncbi:MAG: hypothetical protein KF760_22080 [Candidatus Eremiobacteraeota bacterium]|nr:hypothetical protein [Candidatus Eremiobacteraeota bacterium]MCW5866562.1 hypothetical protein [Candidatus Eremiobacteraeota bacterium]
MFLLHPRISQLINARSVYTPFVSDGLKGATGNILLTQQRNRLVALAQQSLASAGGTASLCGGAAGPGGGPAGAGSGSFSGAAVVAAGGSNGACGGVPVGGQEIGRFFTDGTNFRFSPLNVDNLTEFEALPVPGFGGGSLRMMSLAEEPGGQGGRYDGTGSVGGTDSSSMHLLSTQRNKPRPDPSKDGSKTCPHPPNNPNKK